MRPRIQRVRTRRDGAQPAGDVPATTAAPGQQRRMDATLATRTANAQKAAEAEKERERRIEQVLGWYQQQVLQHLDTSRPDLLSGEQFLHRLQELVRELEHQPGAPAIAGIRNEVAQRLSDEMQGLGPLGPLMRDPQVSDILVNGMGSVYVERRGQLTPVDVHFRDESHITLIAQRIATRVGRRVDELNPMCDARLEDGSRVNLIVPPLAIDGACISIRRFKRGNLDLKWMANIGTASKTMAEFLRLITAARLNVIISGGTGAGKTTMLNALSSEIDRSERIVTLEDAAELSLQQPHVVRLETRPASAEGTGEITMQALLKNALRMRPDRIIVGEVRGVECLEALQAMNTGHPGSMFTIHANNPRDAFLRMEYMCSIADIPQSTVRKFVSSAVDVIVQVSRFQDGKRRIVSVSDVVGLEGDTPVIQEIYVWNESEKSFARTSYRPSFSARLLDDPRFARRFNAFLGKDAMR